MLALIASCLLLPVSDFVARHARIAVITAEHEAALAALRQEMLLLRAAIVDGIVADAASSCQRGARAKVETFSV